MSVSDLVAYLIRKRVKPRPSGRGRIARATQWPYTIAVYVYSIAMQRLQAFKYELRPNGQQERQMRRFSGSCHFVFNKALALQKANH